MYKNIGKKIKTLATVIFALDAIGFFIGGIVLIVVGADSRRGGEEAILLGIAMMIVGPLFAWIASWMLYGFGELIDKTAEIAENTRTGANGAPQYQPVGGTAAPVQNQAQRMAELNDMLRTGLISQEEYNAAVNGNVGAGR